MYRSRTAALNSPEVVVEVGRAGLVEEEGEDAGPSEDCCYYGWPSGSGLSSRQHHTQPSH